jgi:uncharacterized protein with ParB-like and HNH nuclease domain
MKASETKVEDFLSSNKTRFVIPVYQRNYDWSEGQCKQLLDDILEVGSNNVMDAHFIGSVVYVQDGIYTSSKIKELVIIDGQQRLTSLTLIYIALQRLAKELKNEELFNEITNVYLINQYVSEGEKLKLRSSRENDEALNYLLRGDELENFSGFSRIVDNFNYFRGRISVENLQFIQEGLSKLMFVEISLDRHKDNPQRIFESLNSTGLELSQADLIRNYILMDLKPEDQDSIYEDYWKIIEKFAQDETSNRSCVSDYIRDYLTLENKKIPNKSKVYLEFKEKYRATSIKDLKKNLANIKRLVYHYNKLINPQNEPDIDIRRQLEYIDRLKINVAFAFLMKVYDDYASKIINKKTLLDVLELIQSFTWRRFILGLQTNSLNKIFMNLYDKVDHENYLYSIQKTLIQKSGIQRFPKDSEVIDALKFKDFYNINPKNRGYFLSRLENHNNTEVVSIEGNVNITVDHIFPQNPDPQWKRQLGTDEYNFIKENYLNTIANLTLSGNNGKLGNKPFEIKRDLKDVGYRDSRLWLNKYLANLQKWEKAEIEQRFKFISERFLEIWKYPEIDVEPTENSGEINIFDAEDPTHKKLDYAIFLDQKIEVTQISKLYVEVLKKLFEISPTTFFATDLGERIGLVKFPNKNSLRQAAPMNDTYFIETNIDNLNKFEKLKNALTIFNYEEELFIKYTNGNI